MNFTEFPRVLMPVSNWTFAADDRRRSPLARLPLALAAQCQYVGQTTMEQGTSGYDHWTDRWRRLHEACLKRGLTDRWEEGRARPPRFDVGPPATSKEVENVEATIGHRLPSAFREVILGYSGSLSIQWQIPDSLELPNEFRNLFAGECRWNLQETPKLVAQHKSWLDNVFNDPANSYDAVWYRKFPVLSVGNGDMIAISLDEADGPIIYLSHDDGGGHGYRLARDFIDYIERSSALGCPGAEDWQWLPFVDGPDSGLQPNSPAGLRCRRWFGLE